ncbi:Eco57I restriction-modification methylase domain-containing protein, partial [Methanothrix sp.]|uniref:Eco57I restriction-modification methylase domain-containing protein n=1 Tax=Methanothrix sp. TaxID=90426 RepID=UPI003C717077
ETISKQLTLFSERALPDLSRNIKCGNSLIGWDILEDNPNLGQEEIERINPFDWEAEFPEIMKAGGFQVIIGNPPYVRMEELKDVKDYLRKYQAFQARADLYTYFMERETKLIQDKGKLGMIVSNKWMKARYGGPLRHFIAQNLKIHELIDFGELPVFSSVGTFSFLHGQA